MSLETQIAKRYLLQKETGRLGSLLALIGLMGVILSVFSLLFIQFVMSGFSSDVKSKILRFSSPLVISPLKAELFSGKTPPVLPANLKLKEVSPFLETEGIIRTQDEDAQGIKIKGVLISDPMIQSKLKIEYIEGENAESLSSRDDILPGIIIGKELSKRLNVFPGLSEEIDLIYPFGEVDPSGEMHPKTRRFRVIGTFKSGYYEYDNKFALVHLPEARRLVPSAEVATQWALESEDLLGSTHLAQKLNHVLQGNFSVESWGERNQKLFMALKLEKTTMWCVLGLMILIATFNIFSLVMMWVVDKQKEIAIFRAMGLERKRVVRIFSKIGLLIGITGTTLGILLSLGIAAFFKWKPLALPAPYYLDYLPIRIDWLTLGFVFVLAPLLSFLAAWYPAKRGGSFDISDSLRYE